MITKPSTTPVACADLTAVGPLDALELGPGGAQEVDEAVAAARCVAPPALASRASGALAAVAGSSARACRLERLALDLGLGDVGADARRRRRRPRRR